MRLVLNPVGDQEVTPEEHKRLREKDRYAKLSAVEKQDKILKKNEARIKMKISTQGVVLYFFVD